MRHLAIYSTCQSRPYRWLGSEMAGYCTTCRIEESWCNSLLEETCLDQFEDSTQPWYPDYLVLWCHPHSKDTVLGEINTKNSSNYVRFLWLCLKYYFYYLDRCSRLSAWPWSCWRNDYRWFQWESDIYFVLRNKK